MRGSVKKSALILGVLLLSIAAIGQVAVRLTFP